MNSGYLTLIVACLWAIGAVVGYLVTRWAGRTVFGGWTRNDRLYTIVFSPLYGPLMPLMVLVIVLLHKLATCQWGNKQAGW